MLLQARHCHFKEHVVCQTVLFVPVQAVHNVKEPGLALNVVESKKTTEMNRGTGGRLEANAADRRRSGKRFLTQLVCRSEVLAAMVIAVSFPGN
jgi:hypothetical protein